MTISMIAAMAKNRVIGKNNDLPWHLPDDFAFFKDKTKHHVVITGRKNYESIPARFRPLPDRTNIIITKNRHYHAPGAFVMHDLKSAIDYALQSKETEAFIIGGGEIYKQALPFAHCIYLTEIDTAVEGDTFFPEFNANDWKETNRIHHPADAKHAFSFDFVTYVKNNYGTR